MGFMRKSKVQSSRRQPSFTSSNQRPVKSSSYYSKRLDEDIQTGRLVSRKQPKQNYMQFWLQRSGLALLLVVSFVSVIYALNLSNNSRIITLQSSEDSNILRADTIYQTAVNDILAKSFWNRSKLTINTSDVSQQLLDQYPELSSVNVVLPLLAHRPVVYLTASKPALIIVGSSGTYLLDASGKALLAISDVKSVPSFKLPVLTDMSGLQLSLGHRALSSSDITFIQTVIAQLAAKNVVVTALSLPIASREIDASIAGQPYYVKFNLQNGDALNQSGTFLATQARLISRNITPAQYIDVRVPGRAYYK